MTIENPSLSGAEHKDHEHSSSGNPLARWFREMIHAKSKSETPSSVARQDQRRGQVVRNEYTKFVLTDSGIRYFEETLPQEKNGPALRITILPNDD